MSVELAEKIQLSFVPDPIFTTQACDSVDAHHDDNGVLDCFRAHLTHALSHSDTRQAVANVIQRRDAGGPPIGRFVGHGYPGLVTTGGGQDLDLGATDKYISDTNEVNWTPLVLDMRGKFSRFILLGCNSGAGSQGLELLRMLGKFIAGVGGCVVTAPTGLVNCGGGGISYENAPWQTIREIYNIDLPEPISRPERFGRVVYDKFAWTGVANSILGIESVVFLDYHRYDGKYLHLEHGSAQDFLQNIHLHSVLELPGRPLALITGTLVVEWKDNGERKQVKFEIYNDDLFRKTDDDTYYIASSAFIPALSVLL